MKCVSRGRGVQLQSLHINFTVQNFTAAQVQLLIQGGSDCSHCRSTSLQPKLNSWSLGGPTAVNCRSTLLQPKFNSWSWGGSDCSHSWLTESPFCCILNYNSLFTLHSLLIVCSISKSFTHLAQLVEQKRRKNVQDFWNTAVSSHH